MHDPRPKEKTGVVGLLALGAAVAICSVFGVNGNEAFGFCLVMTWASVWWAELKYSGVAESSNPQASIRVILRGLALGALPWLIAQALFVFTLPNVSGFFVDAFASQTMLCLAVLGYGIYRAARSVDIWRLGAADLNVRQMISIIRNITVKAFFLPLMIVFCHGWWQSFAQQTAHNNWHWYLLPLALMYLIDTTFGLIGYAPEPKASHAKIKSSNPYGDAWLLALACYPPFWMILQEIGLQYKRDFDWENWLDPGSPVYWVWGIAILGATFIYTWSTVCFGPRFSNLTNRGIIVYGPYRWIAHPAYLTKNASWWLISVPFIATGSLQNGLYLCLCLVTINLIYLGRAVTEERHLKHDQKYRIYLRSLGRKPIRKSDRTKSALFKWPLIPPLFVLGLALCVKPIGADQAIVELADLLKRENASQAVILHAKRTEESTVALTVIKLSGHEAPIVEEGFPIASINKPLAGLATQLLINNNLLSSSLDVFEAIGLNVASRGGKVTINDLLSHKSGVQAVGVYDPLFAAKNLSLNRELSCIQIVKNLSLKIANDRRTNYQNLNFCLLDAYLYALTGRDYENHLFSLLGLRSEPSSAPSINETCSEIAWLGAAGGLCPSPVSVMETLIGQSAILDRIADRNNGPPINEGLYDMGWRIAAGEDGDKLLIHYGYFKGWFSMIIYKNDHAVGLFSRIVEQHPERLAQKAQKLLEFVLNGVESDSS